MVGEWSSVSNQLANRVYFYRCESHTLPKVGTPKQCTVFEPPQFSAAQFQTAKHWYSFFYCLFRLDPYPIARKNCQYLQGLFHFGHLLPTETI